MYFSVIFHLQFCEWISTPVMCKWAGPVIDLLLEHVGSVQLCNKLSELLDSREEWHSVKRKSSKCHMKIRSTLLHGNVSLSVSSLTSSPKRVTSWPSFLSFVLSCSVTTSTAAPLQIKDSDPDGERQTEIYYKLTSAKQTDQILEPG